jgi:hypothetical protein
MYNRTDSSEEATYERLTRRTLAFHRQAEVSDADSLASFRERFEETRSDQKLLDGLPNCPFLGLLGYDERSDRPARAHRVGCLVHPKQNDGVDGRDCGVYDRHICGEYLCAAHDLLDSREKLLVVQSVQDSYLYGLVVTDVRFVRQLLECAAEINGMSPPARCLQRSEALEAAASYFELKRGWPYAAKDGIFGQIQPGVGLDCSRRLGPSAQLGVEAGPFEAILTCLATEVASPARLREARTMVAERVERFARAVQL